MKTVDFAEIKPGRTYLLLCRNRWASSTFSQFNGKKVVYISETDNLLKFEWATPNLEVETIYRDYFNLAVSGYGSQYTLHSTQCFKSKEMA